MRVNVSIAEQRASATSSRPGGRLQSAHRERRTASGRSRHINILPPSRATVGYPAWTHAAAMQHHSRTATVTTAHNAATCGIALARRRLPAAARASGLARPVRRRRVPGQRWPGRCCSTRSGRRTPPTSRPVSRCSCCPTRSSARSPACCSTAGGASGCCVFANLVRAVAVFGRRRRDRRSASTANRFYACALVVVSVNRFVLSALSAVAAHVVDPPGARHRQRAVAPQWHGGSPPRSAVASRIAIRALVGDTNVGYGIDRARWRRCPTARVRPDRPRLRTRGASGPAVHARRTRETLRAGAARARRRRPARRWHMRPVCYALATIGDAPVLLRRHLRSPRCCSTATTSRMTASSAPGSPGLAPDRSRRRDRVRAGRDRDHPDAHAPRRASVRCRRPCCSCRRPSPRSA